MRRFRVGVQLHLQATTIDELRTAARAADGLGVDSIWVWDHFFPLYGDPDAAHFEAYTVLAALAVDTERARLGALVTCNSYRNPNLLADMARTIDHISHGRFTLGIGSGWFERDHTEYGFAFGTAGERLEALGCDLPIIAERLAALNPPPVGPLPILVGGSGEKVTLRLVARFADGWNAFGPPEGYARKNAILDQHCAEVGRDPRSIERTVALQPSEVADAADFVEAGATHLIVMVGHPFDLTPVATLLAAADA
ncbi:LLM class F420-dependent oxidoreductase [Iamia sp.]|uniref:LLM class F420-dependent oxidoreductase n=1 Tax=Iamia sp. TaxID=2722710 RepID=UPI002BED8894|nr:LLM class F420-dependent oxidoreductase [Iamia sp.]HXH56851.1 LLM class F420-dependent oxidoreductase [Iamia sp.]